jgi:hypothetical protein
MKTFKRMALIACITVMAAGTVFAQDWTKAQKEIWQVVQDGWAKVNAGNIDGFAVCLHEKYQGWNNLQPLPESKEQILKRYKDMAPMTKVEGLELNPARIVMLDNSAVVDYYFWFQQTVTSGDKKTTEEIYGKNVEFWVKEGGKWLLLGDMTMINENKPEEKK